MNTENTNTHIIVGAGLTGMVAALLLRKRHPKQPVFIIEASGQTGGNYRPIDYGEKGRFDPAMRMLYETGIAEIDELIHGLLPEPCWHRLTANRKDIAGLYWNGVLQTHSPYPDLRTLTREDFMQCQREISDLTARNAPPNESNAATYLHSRFGTTAARHFCAALENLYACSASELDVAATFYPAMDRVVMLEEDALRDQINKESIRNRIAWPNQLTLPPLRSFNQAGLYPTTYGMDNPLDRLQQHVQSQNISILFHDTVKTVIPKNGKISQIETRQGKVFNLPAQLYWTGNLAALGSLLGQNIDLPPPPKATLAHVMLRRRPVQMDELYHFYCYQAGFHTFRLTNYAGYCPNAASEGGYPICMELWRMDEEHRTVESVIEDELKAFRLIEKPEDMSIIGISRIPNLHTYYKLESTRKIHRLQRAIRQLQIENLTLIGVFANNRPLLLYEVWQEMYAALENTTR